MAQLLQILAISGSLRAASSNTAALRALSALAPADSQISLSDHIAALPFFNPDLENETDPLPASVQRFREEIGRVDGILICSPEYAHGVPGVLKNALDWLVGSFEFPDKPVALINISPRSTYAHASLLETLKTMSATIIDDPAFNISIPRNRLDMAGMLGDEQVARALSAAIVAFTQSLRSLKQANSEQQMV